MKNFPKFLPVLTCLMLTPIGLQAQEGFPSLGVGPSLGYEDANVDDLKLSGPAGAIRLFQMIPSYPFTFLALDLKLSRLEGDNNIIARRTAASVVAGMMIPVDLFGLKFDNVPEGAGPPIYVGYNFKDELQFEDESLKDVNGEGWKAGIQLPLGPFAVMQFEYSKTEYSESIDQTEPDNQTFESWTYYIQAPIAITQF